MADIISPEKRSRNMSAIRSKNTKPEVYLRKLLFAQGYRYRIADKSVPGHPDIFLRKYNTAIFVNGCFWHRHSGCKYAYMPKSRMEFWQKKFDDNVQRDTIVKAELLKRGIKCLIVWECTIKKMCRSCSYRNFILRECISFILSSDRKAELQNHIVLSIIKKINNSHFHQSIFISYTAFLNVRHFYSHPKSSFQEEYFRSTLHIPIH